MNRVGARRFRRSRYKGALRPRLWRATATAAILALAAANGGCSLSYQLDSLFGGKNDITGSITPPPGTHGAAKLPPEEDLAFTRAAATEVLRRNEKNASLPWENPRTGARGTVTPIASAYTDDGQTCRDFLASYVHGDAQSWLQGEACRPRQGDWQVRSLRPWKSS